MSHAQTKVELETALKASPCLSEAVSPTAELTSHSLSLSWQATTLQLSRILAHQARLQQHGTAQYGPPAPVHLVKQLAKDTQAFDAVCRSVEQRVVSLRHPLLPSRLGTWN